MAVGRLDVRRAAGACASQSPLDLGGGWVAADSSCPDSDGIFNFGTDTELAAFPQTLDLTTDTNTAQLVDIAADGCAKSGLGPAAPVRVPTHIPRLRLTLARNVLTQQLPRQYAPPYGFSRL